MSRAPQRVHRMQRCAARGRGQHGALRCGERQIFDPPQEDEEEEKEEKGVGVEMSSGDVSEHVQGWVERLAGWESG